MIKVRVTKQSNQNNIWRNNNPAMSSRADIKEPKCLVLLLNKYIYQNTGQCQHYSGVGNR